MHLFVFLGRGEEDKIVTLTEKNDIILAMSSDCDAVSPLSEIVVHC